MIVILIGIVFLLWCCLRVAGEADDQMERMWKEYMEEKDDEQ